MADRIGGQKIRDLLGKIRRKYKHLGEKNVNLIIEALSTYDGNQTLADAVTEHANKKA